MPKNVQTTAQLHLFYMLARLMLKILQARLQQYMNWKVPEVQAGFKKAEEPEIKLPTSTASYKKKGNSKETSTSASMNVLKLLTVWITTNQRKFLKRWEYQTTLPLSWETHMQAKRKQLEPGMEQ